jgi:hypothetical protein
MSAVSMYINLSNLTSKYVAGITIEYLTGLHAAYEEFITEISRTIPVIKVCAWYIYSVEW